jgi:hypothetical protein
MDLEHSRNEKLIFLLHPPRPFRQPDQIRPFRHPPDDRFRRKENDIFSDPYP